VSPFFYVSLGSWVISLTVFDANVTNLNEPPRALATPAIAWPLSRCKQNATQVKGVIISLALHYWMRVAHHCSGSPVSEMTYTVLSRMLNSTIHTFWMPAWLCYMQLFIIPSDNFYFSQSMPMERKPNSNSSYSDSSNNICRSESICLWNILWICSRRWRIVHSRWQHWSCKGRWRCRHGLRNGDRTAAANPGEGGESRGDWNRIPSPGCRSWRVRGAGDRGKLGNRHDQKEEVASRRQIRSTWQERSQPGNERYHCRCNEHSANGLHARNSACKIQLHVHNSLRLLRFCFLSAVLHIISFVNCPRSYFNFMMTLPSPYLMGNACYHLLLRPPLGPVHISELTFRLVQPLGVFSRLQKRPPMFMTP